MTVTTMKKVKCWNGIKDTFKIGDDYDVVGATLQEVCIADKLGKIHSFTTIEGDTDFKNHFYAIA